MRALHSEFTLPNKKNTGFEGWDLNCFSFKGFLLDLGIYAGLLLTLIIDIMKFKWLCCVDSEEVVKQPDPITPEIPPSNFARRLSTFLLKNTDALNKLVVPVNQSLTSFPCLLNISIIESPGNQTVKPFRIFANGLGNCEGVSGQVYLGLDSERNFCFTCSPDLAEKSLCIYFDTFLQKFFIIDLSLNTFIKISNKKAIEGNYLISFIDKKILVAGNKQQLKVKVTESGEEFEFSQTDSPVLIGRSETCQVKVFGKNISRVQCSFLYEDGWVLKDGYEEVSRNGTWFMPIEKTEVFNGMVFNVNKIIFSVNVEETIQGA